MSWGHAVSPDLFRWQHLPVPIPEKDGVMAFSGSAVVDHQNTSGFGKNGQPPLVAIYTSRTEADQTQSIAYSNDRGRAWAEYGGNPVLEVEDSAEAIRYVGSRDRIDHVHFRDVRVETPCYKCVEAMHDEGDCDMPACMRAFQEVGYSRLLIPDHTPEFTDDTLGNQVGWAFALGYLQALRHAAEC